MGPQAYMWEILFIRAFRLVAQELAFQQVSQEEKASKSDLKFEKSFQKKVLSKKSFQSFESQ